MSAFSVGLVLGQLAGVAPTGVGEERHIAGALTVGDRNEIRYRTASDGPSAIDLEIGPRASFALRGPRSGLLLHYSPAFSYLDIERSRSVALIHAGGVAVDYRMRRLTLRATADGSIGTQSAVGVSPTLAARAAAAARPPSLETTPSAGPQPPVAPNPTQTIFVPGNQVLVLTTGSFFGSLGAVYGLSRRWTGSATGSYSMSGGLDFESQALLRPNRGPSASVSADYAASAHDHFTSQLSGSYVVAVKTPLFPRQGFVTASVTEWWSRAWSSRTTTAVGGGLSYIDSEGGDAGDSLTEAGGAFLTYGIPFRDASRMAFGASANVGAAYNPVVAVVESQATGAVSASFTTRRVLVSLEADAATSVPFEEAAGSRALAASGSVAYAPVDYLFLDVGVRASSQILPARLGGARPLTWILFLAVDFHAPIFEF